MLALCYQLIFSVSVHQGNSISTLVLRALRARQAHWPAENSALAGRHTTTGADFEPPGR
jgi:hypothetical protein